MDNNALNSQNTVKKKSKVWPVIRTILVFFLGLILGSGSVLLVAILVIALILGLNGQKMAKLAGNSDFLTQESLEKIDLLH